jgi:hypothetical protein
MPDGRGFSVGAASAATVSWTHPERSNGAGERSGPKGISKDLQRSSFRGKPESNLIFETATWIPAFAGMTSKWRIFEVP